jgi:glucose/arabinose dehydrogenase
MRILLLPLALLGVLAVLGLASRDDADEPAPEPQVKLVEAGRFEEPVYVTSPPGDDRLFVVGRKGRVWILDAGETRLPRPFLDISDKVSSSGLEEGLLSLAFAPDYDTSGRFYVDYTDRQHRTIVEEYRSPPLGDVADPATARRVLVISNPTERHHGGLVLFGPDGYLYISQGDGGIFHDLAFPSLRLDNLHGKILRIDPRPQGDRPYRIPPDNPYVGRPGRDEIWVYGLRNPWRFGFDPATGDLVIGDVGQVRIEEIDVAPRAGLNFGWPCLEGTEPFNPEAPRSAPAGSCDDLVPPELEVLRSPAADVEPEGEEPTVTRGRPRAWVRFTPGQGWCSIAPGVVASADWLPGLAGRHLYGDFCQPGLHSFRLEDAKAVDERPLGVDVFVLSSLGVDASGRVYATSLAGPVYRLEAG